MLKLYELEDRRIVPQLPPYDSDKWYLAIIPLINEYLFEYFGERNVILSRRAINVIKQGGTFNDLLDQVEQDIKRNINLVFNSNILKYRQMYDVMTTEYNPIWNVDGVETRVYTRDNTGTVGHAGTNTGTQSTSGSNTGTQSTSGSDTGTQSTSGSNTGTQGTSGTDTGTQTTADTTSVTSEHDVTTFDSQSYAHNDKTTDTHSGSITRTDNLAHSETRTDNLAHSETRTDNLAHSETRTDNLAHSETRTDNLASSDTRTDNLKEEYSETYERHGNIGVTSSQSLVEQSLNLAGRMNFMEIVAEDIIKSITCNVYD